MQAVTHRVLDESGVLQGWSPKLHKVMSQGTITCVKRSKGIQEAHIALTDLKNVRIRLPWQQAQQHLFVSAGA